MLSLPLNFLSHPNPILLSPTNQRHSPALPPTDWLHTLLPPLISLTKSIRIWMLSSGLGFWWAALILQVVVSISLPLDLPDCWIFILDSLFVSFLFRFFIWFYGCFCLSDMDFWVVGGWFLSGWWWFGGWWLFFLVVGGKFLNLCWWFWRLFFERLVMIWWLVVILVALVYLGRWWWLMEWDYNGYVFAMVGALDMWWLVVVDLYLQFLRTQHLSNTCKCFIVKYFISKTNPKRGKNILTLPLPQLGNSLPEKKFYDLV